MPSTAAAAGEGLQGGQTAPQGGHKRPRETSDSGEDQSSHSKLATASGAGDSEMTLDQVRERLLLQVTRQAEAPQVPSHAPVGDAGGITHAELRQRVLQSPGAFGAPNAAEASLGSM